MSPVAYFYHKDYSERGESKKRSRNHVVSFIFFKSMMRSKCVRVIHRGASGISDKILSSSDNQITISTSHQWLEEEEKVIILRVQKSKKNSMINISWFSRSTDVLEHRQKSFSTSFLPRCLVLFVYITLDIDLIIYFIRQLWFMRRTTTNIYTYRYIFTDRKKTTRFIDS